jgi:ribonuclease Y
MTLLRVALLIGASGLAGIIVGYFLRLLISAGKKGSVELLIKQRLLEAKGNAQAIIEEAEKKASVAAEEIRKDAKEKEAEIKRNENRLIKKDELLDKRQTDIDKEAENLKAQGLEVKAQKETVLTLEAKAQGELERVAKLTMEEAAKELFARTEKNYEEDFLVRMKKLETTAAEKLDRRAKEILTTAVQRLAASSVSEITTTSVPITSDEIKGKIIGKEGRNIRAFERAVGAELIVDDTPGVVVISSFDPIRRHIAKLALERLIADGRIQPAKIEEFVQKAKTEINKIIKERGEQAAAETGVLNLDPRLYMILGRLHFRTSYGQNVLQHSVEMAHIAGMLAEELGADVAIARAGALLHDIGKALDHEVQGTHVDIGRRILKKFGADERIIKAMQSHHEEYEYETPESIIVQTADAISGGRPGARRDSVENYVKRLGDLENIANDFEGVEKSYAIAAGREIRVFVTPEAVSDIEAKNMARNIALKIEKELKYPGEIKVHVIRETRVVEYAR